MSPALDTCGCFPVAEGPPVRPDNLPGLDTIAYRIATHPVALARMLAALPKIGVESDLARLTTRSPDDPAIALLDAFAVVADVLSFYSERIANEGYLRTAIERRSILELARAIGYELGPGVAANAFLAFVVEDRVPGAGTLASGPAEARIRAGTRVQSLPAGGGFPQSFETGEPLVARAEWNELRPQLTQEQDLDDSATALYLAGTASEVREGDVLLLAAPGPSGQVVGNPKARRVHRVILEPESRRTKIELAPAAAEPLGKAQPALLPGLIGSEKVMLTGARADLTIGKSLWSERNLRTLLNVYGWRPAALMRYFAPRPPEPPDLPPAAPGVYAFGAQGAVFGHNAPKWVSLPASMRYGAMVQKDATTSAWETGPYPKDWDTEPGVNITTDSQGNSIGTDTVRLDTTYRVGPDSWLLLAGSNLDTAQPYRVADVADISVADFGISAKLTRLKLKSPAGATPGDLSSFKPRSTTVLLQSRRLELAEVSLPDTIPASTTSLELDRLVLGLPEGHPVALTGERADLPGAGATEILRLTEVTHAGGRTTLHFGAPGIFDPYLRRTISINANVATATHGETVEREVLGSGNGQAHHRFTLRKPPLTYVSASTPSGAKSTLEIRVDGVRWDEAPSLHELGPTEERYIVQRDDDGTTTVIFGDGVHGARVPSGAENVVAHYRSGIGSKGMVDARALTLLTVRPPGVREVTNPLPAEGAEDPEPREAARRNAPLTVVTLDRIVSLTDYEDFARAFAGIGKARATALWHGERPAVHITVAGPNGAEVAPGSKTFTNLVGALEKVRDPGSELEVEGFRRLFFHLAAEVAVHPRHEAQPVLEAVRAALARAFDFDRREFGQGVSRAEAIAVIMGVSGVLDTTIPQLYIIVHGLDPPPDVLQDPLLARLAHWEGASGSIEPAELLLLNPAGARITERGT